VTREKLKALLSEYGRVAVYTYLGLFVLVLAGFTLAIAWGVDIETTHGGAGALGAAYLATKATQPLRIAATLGLTPLVAAGLKRVTAWRTGQRPPSGQPSDQKSEQSAAD
jgi:hypothetical protein